MGSRHAGGRSSKTSSHSIEITAFFMKDNQRIISKTSNGNANANSFKQEMTTFKTIKNIDKEKRI
jgi:hypothetical protein